MPKLSFAALIATAAVLAATPFAFAGDLGDGGYGSRGEGYGRRAEGYAPRGEGYAPRAYGDHRPYDSGNDDEADQNYGRHQDADDGDNDDDDDDRADNRPNDGSDYDDGAENDDRDDGDRRYRDGDRDDPRFEHRYGSTKDDDPPRGYDSAPRAYYDAPRAYNDAPRLHRGICVPGWRVKQRLIGEGWSHFHLNAYGRGVAVVRAMRVHTGRPFVLRIDGCTGATLSSVPAGPRRWTNVRPDLRHSSW